MASDIRIADFPLKDETNNIINAGIEIHKILGHGFLEIVYKDAFEYEFKRRNHHYGREKMYSILYKDIILPHKFYADFVVLVILFWRLKQKMESLKMTMHKRLTT